MFVQVITPATDPTPILTVAEALQEFREQDPSAGAGSLGAADCRGGAGVSEGNRGAPAAGDGPGGRPIGLHTDGVAAGRSPPDHHGVWHATARPAIRLTLRIVGINTIAFATHDGWGYGYGFSGQLTIEAEVGFDPADIATQEPEIKQALLSLVGYWAESGREAAQSQTAPLGGPVGETPLT